MQAPVRSIALLGLLLSLAALSVPAAADVKLQFGFGGPGIERYYHGDRPGHHRHERRRRHFRDHFHGHRPRHFGPRVQRVCHAHGGRYHCHVYPLRHWRRSYHHDHRRHFRRFPFLRIYID